MANEDDCVVDHRDEGRSVFAEGSAEAELVYRVNGPRLILVHTDLTPSLHGWPPSAQAHVVNVEVRLR